MRVTTRISIASGTLLVIFLAVVAFYANKARELEESNEQIEMLIPLRDNAQEGKVLPATAYPLMARYFTTLKPAPVGYLLQARATQELGRADMAEILTLCPENHQPLSMAEIRSSIPSREYAPPPPIEIEVESLDELEPRAEGVEGAGPSAGPSVIAETRTLFEPLDREALDRLLCHREHQGDTRCQIAHASQKVVALWDTLAVATTYHAALTPEDEPIEAGIATAAPNPGTPPDGGAPIAPEAEDETATAPPEVPEGEAREFWSRDAVTELFVDIRRDSQLIQETLAKVIAERLMLAREQRKSAESVGITMAVVAVLASLFSVWLMIRSFLHPVRELKAATRAVAEGQFRYKLDTSTRDEFSGLSASFNRMVTKIAELDQLKTEFLSHISHELRTPLAAMQETTNLLLDGAPGPINPKQRRLLDLTNKNCKRLTTMITQLLDLSRMDRGALVYEDRPHDFTSIVQGVIASQAKAIEKQGVEMISTLPDKPLVIRGDPDRLTEVLENLLTNAIKFSPRDAAINLRLTRPGDSGHRRLNTPSGASTERDLLCAISDRGPGVPDLHKEKIFEKFHQVDRRPKGSGGGVGLGLAICREIIAAHDGEIWVDDNETSGSTFYFTLPSSRLDSTDPGTLI